MSKALLSRCDNRCELCSCESALTIFDVPHSNERPSGQDDTRIMLCETCLGQINDSSTIDINHWRCLNDSMWSPVAPVQIMAWRMLTQISDEAWARDLLDMLYLDDDLLAWAKAGIVDEEEDESVPLHRDCNGVILQPGDNVVVTKDLNVKGTSFTAKRGTTVRGISLPDNPEHLEGRVNGTRVVLLTCFVKKV